MTITTGAIGTSSVKRAVFEAEGEEEVQAARVNTEERATFENGRGRPRREDDGTRQWQEEERAGVTTASAVAAAFQWHPCRLLLISATTVASASTHPFSTSSGTLSPGSTCGSSPSCSDAGHYVVLSDGVIDAVTAAPDDGLSGRAEWDGGRAEGGGESSGCRRFQEVEVC